MAGRIESRELRSWRAGVKLSQRAAARRLGVSVRTYQNWELGRHSPTNSLLVRMRMQQTRKPKG